SQRRRLQGHGRRGRPQSLPLALYRAIQEFVDARADFMDVRFEREVAGVEELDLGLRQVALVGLGAGRDEEGIVAAPDGEQRRLALPEILVEGRIERDVGLVV